MRKLSIPAPPLRYPNKAKAGITHGMSNTLTHRSWMNMHTRCAKPAGRQNYENYAGRGIVVCERWSGPNGFANFFADVGERPAGMTIDRIDNDKGYEPGNVRWASKAVQQQNRRACVLTVALVNEIRGRYEHGEPTMSIARSMGISGQRVGKVTSRKQWANVP